MITLEQAKTLIGMPVKAPLAGTFRVEEIRQLNCGKILAYNKRGWCCDVNILRDTKGKKFNFDDQQD